MTIINHWHYDWKGV